MAGQAARFLARPINLGVATWPLWAILAVAVYWFWPNDLIHDGLPFVGHLDDVSLSVGLVVATMKQRR